VKVEESSVVALDGVDGSDVTLNGHPSRITQEFGWGRLSTPFRSGGVMLNREVWTRDVRAEHEGPYAVLRDVLVADKHVPEEFFILEEQLQQWAYLKGAKREQREAKSGHRYEYTEGAIAFPDPLDQASRTILTGEGGSTPSRFKHVIQTTDGRYRRLVPVELELLNGFPEDWTKTGMSDGRRAFMMGNALVVGLVRLVGSAMDAVSPTRDQARPLVTVSSA
jgi:DNA (cytosine-5)-methyltransferase 1